LIAESLAGTDFSEPEIDRFVMAIAAGEAMVRHIARCSPSARFRTIQI
jgi:hypothetical protein